MHLHLYYLDTFILILITTLLYMAVWYYRKVIVPYNDFPSVSTVEFYKHLLFKPIPKNITPVSFHFQAMIAFCKQFQSEGLCFMWLLDPYLFIFSEEAIKLFSNEEAVLNKTHNYEVFHYVLGKGLITSNGDQWKKQRKALNPAFNATALKGKVPIFNKHTRTLVEQLLEVPHDSVDIHKYLKICTFSTICETIIGLDVKERVIEVEQITKLISQLSDKAIEVVFHPWQNPKYSFNLFSGARKILCQVRQLREFMTKILLEMKEDTLSRQKAMRLDESEDPCSVQRKSFAQRLVQLHLEDPSSFTLDYMLDELTTVVLAGYDTTSYALLWCLFLLGHHQDVQDQVYNELESVTAGDVTSDDLPNLTYMDCVIKESLRLYPAVPLYARRLEKNIQLEKYTVPKGTNIVFCPYLYHRNPKLYPDPEKFDPGRFSGGSEQPAWTYVPFAEGMRSCIGKKFALLEIKIVLAHVLRNFKITSLDRREDVNVRWNITLVPDKALHMRLTPRRE